MIHDKLLKKQEKEIIKEIETIAKNKMSNRPELFYHTYDHALEVRASTIWLCNKEGIKEYETFLMNIAALFHDSVYLLEHQKNPNDKYTNEQKSSLFARNQLSKMDFDNSEILFIERIIWATDLKVVPKDIYQFIIRDADAHNVGSKKFEEKSRLLWKEQGVEVPGIDNYISDYMFIKNHRFYTDTAREFWGPRKENNKINLLNKIKAMGYKFNNS